MNYSTIAFGKRLAKYVQNAALGFGLASLGVFGLVDAAFASNVSTGGDPNAINPARKNGHGNNGPELLRPSTPEEVMERTLRIQRESGVTTMGAGDQVAVFIDTAVVNYAPGAPSAEASNVVASLNAQGNTVTTFTGATGAAWSAALAGKDVLVIPEQESGSLLTYLDASAEQAIRDFVAAGGGLVIQSDYNLALNGLFGYSMGYSFSGTSTLQLAASTGTPFAGGPASVPAPSATFRMTGLPAGASCYYFDGVGCTVFSVTHGLGRIVYYGWDFFNASPTGSGDGGWLSILDRSIALATLSLTPTTTTITSITPSPSSSSGETVAVTVSVAGADPTGTVTVSAQNASPARSCVATVSGSPTATGSCTFSVGGMNDLRVAQGLTGFVASYAGDVNDVASSSALTVHSVTQATVTSLTASGVPAAAVVTEPFAVTVSSTTSNSEALIGDGTGADDIVLSAPGSDGCGIDLDAVETSCVMHFHTVPSIILRAKGGNYAKVMATINASYLGSSEFASSGPETIGTLDVAPADTTTTLTSLGENAGTDPSPAGDQIVLTANVVVDPPGSGPASGTVRFVDGSANTLAEVPLDLSGSASFTVSPAPGMPGAPSFNAFFLSNPSFNGSDDGDTHTVVQGNTSTTIVSIVPAGAPDIETAESVTVTVSVAAVAPASGTPSGTIEVRDSVGGAESTGCDIVLPATSCPLTYSTRGASTLTATYLGDTSFVGSSDSDAVTVLGQTVTLTLTPPTVYFGNAYAVAYNLDGGSGAYNGAMSMTSDAAVGTCGAPDGNGEGVCNFSAGQNAGTYALAASYAGDTVNADASAGGSQVILPAEVNIDISDAPDNGIEVGLPITISATTSLANGTGTATGSIAITGANTAGCTIALSGGSGTCNLSFSAPGAGQVLTGTYTSDSGNYVGDDAPEIDTETHDVVNAITTLTIVPVADAPIGTAVTVSYTLSGCFGTCDGAVTVVAQPGSISCPAPSAFSGSGTASGSCTFPTNAFQTTGSYTIDVIVADSANEDGDSGTTSFTAIAADSATALVIAPPPPGPHPAGTTFTFTVTVVPAPGFDLATVPAGSVTVFDGMTPVSGCESMTLTAGAASCTPTFNNVQTLSLTASYGGDTNFNGSAAAAQVVNINEAPTTITATRTPASNTIVGRDVVVDFDVDGGADAGSGRYLGMVTVSAGGPGCGPVAVNPADGTGSCTIDGATASGFLTAGTFNIVATYSGDANDQSSASAPIAHTVVIAPTSTVLSSMDNPSLPGETFLLRAVVSAPAPSEATPTGNVEFFIVGGASLGVRPLVGGMADLTGLTRPAGTFDFRVAYLGNADFATSQDTSHVHLVNQGTLSFSVLTSPNPSTVLAPVTATISLTPVPDAVTPPIGNVTVAIATGESCVIALPATSCSFNPGTKGTHLVTATYGGDANYLAPADATTSHVVDPLPVTMTLGTSTPDPVYYGVGYSIPYTLTGGDGVFNGAATLQSGAASGTCSHVTSTGVGSCVFAAGQDAGSLVLSGAYAGDSTDDTATTSGLLTISPAEFSFVIADTPDDGALVNATVQIEATLAPINGVGTPNGSITITGDNTAGCSIALGGAPPYTCDLTFLTRGLKNLGGAYAQGVPANFIAVGPAATATHTVSPLPTVLAVGTVPSDVNFGENYSIPYVLSNGQAPYSGAVSMTSGVATGTCAHDNGTGIGACAFTSGQNAATYSLSASYAGDDVNDSATDSDDSITIAPAVLSITLADSPDPTEVGAALVTVTATIVVTDGAGTPDGSIAVAAGSGGVDCTITLPASSCDVTYSTIGVKTIAGTYTSSSGNFVATVGDPASITHAVNQATTTTVVSLTNQPVVIGDQVDVSFQISGCFTGCDGSVTVTAPNGQLSGDTVSPAVCAPVSFDSGTGLGSCSFPAGTFREVQLYTVTVAFAGSGDDADSTGTADFTPGKATATLALSSLSHVYDGLPHGASVAATCSANASVTAPACDGLLLSEIPLRYALASQTCLDATSTEPVSVGDYIVCADVIDDNFQGSASAAFEIDASTVLVDLDGPSVGVAVGEAGTYLVKLDNVDVVSPLPEGVAFEVEIVLAPGSDPDLFLVEYDDGSGYADAGAGTVGGPNGGRVFVFDNSGAGYPVAAASSLVHQLRVYFAEDADYDLHLLARGVGSLTYGVDRVDTTVIEPQGQIQLDLTGPTNGVQLFSDTVFLGALRNLGGALPETARVEFCLTVTPEGDITPRDATAADVDLLFEYGPTTAYGVGPAPLMLVNGCATTSANAIPAAFEFYSRVTASFATAGSYVQTLSLVGDGGTIYATTNLATVVSDLPPAGRSLDFEGPLSSQVGVVSDFTSELRNNASAIAGNEEFRLRMQRNGNPATAADLTIEYSLDAGATWDTLLLDSNGWGTVLPNTDTPVFDFAPNDVRDALYRVTYHQVGVYVGTTQLRGEAAPNALYLSDVVTTDVARGDAQISISNLSQLYTGTPRPATVAVLPASIPPASITTTYQSISYGPSTTAPSDIGSYTVTVVVNDLNYEGTATATLNIVASTPSTMSFTVDGAATDTATVATTGAYTFAATVLDASNNPVPGVSVAFSAAGGAISPASATALTDSSGVATFVANAGQTAGTFAVTAEVATSGAPLVATVAVTNVAGTATTLQQVSGDDQTAPVNAAFADLVVRVVDAFGNPVSGQSVTFTATGATANAVLVPASPATVSTNGAGLASVDATANAMAGSYTVTAASTGLTPASVDFNLTNTATNPATVVIDALTASATVNTAFATPVCATVADASSNLLPGVSVTFSASTVGGASATFVTNPALTDVNGEACTVVTANTVAGGAYALTATVAATPTALSDTDGALTNVAGVATALQVVSGNNQAQAVSGTFSAPLVVRTVDAFGNLVTAAGTPVTFVAPVSGASATILGSPDNTDANGEASVTAVANAGAGSYQVTASSPGLTDATFSLTNTAGTIAISNIRWVANDSTSIVFNDTDRVATFDTSPSTPVGDCAVSYNAGTTLPHDAGSYVVGVTCANVNGSGSGTASLTIAQAASGVVVNGTATATYDGQPNPVVIATNPNNVALGVSYSGTTAGGASYGPTSIPPTDAGTYTATVTVLDLNYSGGPFTQTITVAPKPVTVVFSNLTHVYSGTTKAATATFSDAAAGTPVLTYVPAAPTNAGAYTVTASLTNPNYTLAGDVDETLTIAQATAQVTLSNLTQIFDGTPKPVLVTTVPAGLGVNVTYAGNPPPAPSAVGSYAVTATVADVNYQGTASGTLTILAAGVSQFVTCSATSVSGTAGAPLASVGRPCVRVLDSNGNGVAGISILFNVTGGGGSATGTSATTAADGRATVASWTLGATAGANTLTAQVNGLAGLPTHTFTANGAELAGVSMSKTSATTQAMPGDAITYSLVVTHAAGSSNAAAVDILDALPAQLDVGTATWLCAGTGGATCSVPNGTGDVDVTAAIPVGASVTVTVTATVRLDATLGAMLNTATAELTSSTDPDTSNNTDDHSITLVPRPDGPCSVFCDGFEGDDIVKAMAADKALRAEQPIMVRLPGLASGVVTPLFEVIGTDAKALGAVDVLAVGEGRWFRLRHRDVLGQERFTAWSPLAADAVGFDWVLDVDGVSLRSFAHGQTGQLSVPLEAGRPLPQVLRAIGLHH